MRLQIRLPQPYKVAATLFATLFCVWYFCGIVVVLLWYCCGIVVIWLWYVCGGRGKQHSPNGRTKDPGHPGPEVLTVDAGDG